MERTPYSVGPYGKDKFPYRLGPNAGLMKEKYIFETGKNEWQKYAQWPLSDMQPVHYFLREHGGLGSVHDTNVKEYTEYNYDPARPVPYTNLISRGRNNEYMADNQII